MNKKLRLLVYLFNYYPVKDTEPELDGYSMMKYLLEDESVVEGINEILDIQNESNWIYNNPISFGSLNTNPSGSIIISGDTVSKQIELTEGKITLGATSITEEDLKKIKKAANII